MVKKLLVLLCSLFLVFGMVGSALAGTFDFDGYIDYHNDVVFFDFSLAVDATNVRVWTDSFQSGANFDPITALWTGIGELVAENDDDDTINPATQTYWDSGFALPTLSAGDYIFSVAAYDNFASGITLAQGFAYDGETPIPIEGWWECAPGYYHVILDGVDSASGPDQSVPEPATMLLLGSGLLGLGIFGRKKFFNRS